MPESLAPSLIVGVLVLQVALGLLLRESDAASTAFTVVLVLTAFVVALRSPRVEWIAAVAGYLVAAEVLWRMTGADVFWETGKYATAGVLAIGAIRFFAGWRRLLAPGVYLAMFVPGVIVAVDRFGWSGAREPVSFNVSGPLALAVAVAFFVSFRSTIAGFRIVLWCMVLPVVSIATVVLVGVLSAPHINFVNDSNVATSGGFGPNQVSAVLGFGVLACVVLAGTETATRLRVVELGLAAWFLAHAVLTFSRGGVVNVVVAIVVGALVLRFRPHRVSRVAWVVVIVVVAAAAVIIPRLDDATGGKLLSRYEDQTFTKRNSLVENDLELFRDHPVFGVGVGVSRTERPASAKGEAAHTEYTRLLAEQGVFGLVALGALVAIAVGALRRAPPGLLRALVAALLAWSLTEMAHSAMRIALTSFVVGLAVGASGVVVDTVGDDADADATTLRSPET